MIAYRRNTERNSAKRAANDQAIGYPSDGLDAGVRC
ncbi:MAG: hypothetical protein JWO97_2992 [Acidobacteria bacterium]|nr:hypothetical protein [Acidobacteriota bacterium]